jgi:peptidoglycan L-alanyl-D-glutamate endopeptidase CwlK
MIIQDTLSLHLVFRERLQRLLDRLKHEVDPSMMVYETWRSPLRQALLYAKGRAAGDPGPRVTKAGPWQSYHQFGLAADIVMYEKGAPTWPTAADIRWTKMRAIAIEEKLRTLSFEMPHVELPWDTGRLRMGEYPAGGGQAWEAQLEAFIHAMPAGSPPIPTGRPEVT